MKRVIFLFILLAGMTMSNYAQKAPIKFGKPEMSDLQMTVYEPDTSAEAVVLCEYGYFDPNLLRFSRTIRLKILKPEGTHWADWKFRSGSETNVEGFVFNLVDGQVVKEKLKSSSVYREKVIDDLYRYRIAFPNVKVGTVVDIEYSAPGLPVEFYFQYDIPVKWSELIIYEHNAIQFSKNFFGFVPLTIATDTRWAVGNVPAFKSEPFINSENNYKTHFEFDLKSVTYSGFKYQAYATTWENVNKLLLNYTDFGDAIQGTMFLNSEADRILALPISPKRRMIEAFNSIKRLKWDGVEQLGISNAVLGTAYKNGTGNSSDVNLSLLVLLRKLNIDAEPVALSSRSNGILSDFFPSLFKLNYAIVIAYIDGKSYLLDATEKYMPYDLLPARAMNGKGRIVDNDRNEWVPLVCDKKDKSNFFYDFTLSPDLVLTGKMSSGYSDYAALDFRKDYFNFTSKEEFIEDFEKSNTGFKIISAEINNLDSLNLPVKCEYNMEISDQAEQVGDEIHLKMFFDQQLTENPFKQETRLCNIDFDYPWEQTITVKIVVPDNMTIVSVPKAARLTLPENSGQITYNAAMSGNTISMTFKWGINRSRFNVNEYGYLKEFFNQLIAKQSEPIVLKMK